MSQQSGQVSVARTAPPIRDATAVTPGKAEESLGQPFHTSRWQIFAGQHDKRVCVINE